MVHAVLIALLGTSVHALAAPDRCLHKARPLSEWKGCVSHRVFLARPRGRQGLVVAKGGSVSEERWSLPAPVGAILAAAFLNLLGFTMAGPITPALGQHFGLEAGSRVGMLTSAYPAGMLVGLLIWPSASDRPGMRKRVLVGSLCGVGCGLGFQAACLELNWPLWAFLSLRAMSGAFAGASPVAKAYLADAAKDGDQLPRWLAWREAAATLAFIVGPSLGGLLYYATNSLASVMAATSVGSLLAAALVARFATKSQPRPQRGDQPLLEDDHGLAPIACPLGTRLVAAVATIVCVSSLENAGSAAWDAFGPLVAQRTYGLGPRALGGLLTAGACASFVVSTTLFEPISKRLGIVATAVLGLGFVGSGLLGVALAQPSSFTNFIAGAALYQIGKPLYAPTLPSLLLCCVPPHRRGFIMGLDSVFNTVARALSPVLLGSLISPYTHFTCFAAASAFVFTAAALACFRGFQVAATKRSSAPELSQSVR